MFAGGLCIVGCLCVSCLAVYGLGFVVCCYDLVLTCLTLWVFGCCLVVYLGLAGLLDCCCFGLLGLLICLLDLVLPTGGYLFVVWDVSCFEFWFGV